MDDAAKVMEYTLLPLSGAVSTVDDAAVTAAKNALNTARDRVSVLRQSGRGDLFTAAARCINPCELMPRVARRTTVSRAYYKLWEILHKYALLNTLQECRTVHLCEAPGAFVQATRDYWRYLRNSAPDLRCVSVTLPDDLEWKDDASASTVVYADIFESFEQDPRFKEVDLVTGDGGFEISVEDKNAQETLNHALFQRQVELAMQMLRPGGCMVIKFFDMFTDATWSVLETAHQNFARVVISKPLGSRVCNSERYLVGIGKYKSPPSGSVNWARVLRNQCRHIAVDMATKQTAALNAAIGTVQRNWNASPWTLTNEHRRAWRAMATALEALVQLGL